MIKKLLIKNFKSIKELSIDCKRINLFIGEPNTGKSNILEALGLLSWLGHLNQDLIEYVRFRETPNLFFDNIIDQSAELFVENEKKINVELKFQEEKCNFLQVPINGNKSLLCSLSYEGNHHGSKTMLSELRFIKFYKFKRQEKFPGKDISFLETPNGVNLFALVMGIKELRETMGRFFKNFGFNLVLKPQERTFDIQKQVEDIVISYPYILASDTLQRIVFYVVAIDSNKDSTLIFEEPESHAFPYYTKYLGEKIARDDSNQYFIATHNPYLLLSILEKANKDDVNVFITYYKDYQTKVECFSGDLLCNLMAYDPFANLDSFVKKEEG